MPITARSPHRARHAFRALALHLAVATPGPAWAAFNCEQSVIYQGTWCTGSQITSIPRADAAAICADFTDRLARQCRPDWDKFKSCSDFARRFETLLVQSCLDRRVGPKPCRSWGQAFAGGTLARCQRGRFSF